MVLLTILIYPTLICGLFSLISLIPDGMIDPLDVKDDKGFEQGERK
jgi:hypothetical protein